MKNLLIIFLSLLIFTTISCSVEKVAKQAAPFDWNAANLYFLLTDRFNNGDSANDLNFNRTEPTGKFREFMGGDIKGIIQKLEEGYFDKLGINAIWFTPVFEQIHGAVDEGTGNTYGYHGYWIKDWTRLDPNFGTEEELAAMIKLAHSKGIRIVMDVVINHRGPVTDQDPNFELSWVRTEPQCTYQDSKTTIPCTLVKNLPDVLTESNEEVELPKELVEKFKKEGRYEKEIKELNEFFTTNKLTKAPRFYIMKWLTDYVKKYGIDGFRVDTVKHTEEGIWAELNELAQKAFAEWKTNHPTAVLDTNKFHMLGEVYNYTIDGGQNFHFGDREVNYYKNGFHSLINFGFKYHATKSYEEIFTKYDSILLNHMDGNTVVNYLTSHDDGQPFDKKREKTFEAGTKLLLSPGMAQVYYGDETARNLDFADVEGDATLRSFMNWDEIKNNSQRHGIHVNDVLSHYRKLGVFRKENPAVGAGRHTMISRSPYIFKREYQKNAYTNRVVVGLDLPKGEKVISVINIFENGTELYDYYSNTSFKVKNGLVTINNQETIVLLGIK